MTDQVDTLNSQLTDVCKPNISLGDIMVNIVERYPKLPVGFRGGDTGKKQQMVTANVSQSRDLFRERRPAFGSYHKPG